MRGFFAAALSIALLAVVHPAQAAEGFEVWHQGRQLQAVDRDGWAVYQGDIVLGRTAELRARSLVEGPDGLKIGGIEKSVTLGGPGGRWLKNAAGIYELPYEVESDPKNIVPGAVAIFNQQLAGFMQAVPHTTQSDYVAFALTASDTSGACSSRVGRIGGRQAINGSQDCGSGVLVHEMGHSVGLWHEQEHADRDRFVTLDTSVVEPVAVFNFAQTPGQRSATPYDYASIMHYAATSFSRNGLASMETIPPGIGIGQRDLYSAGDLEAIRRLYGAPPQLITVTSLPTGLQVIVDGATVTTPTTFNWAIGSTHTLDVPPTAQQGGGATNIFARWNVDRFGDLQARRTITVAAGDGTITSPASAPAISTYTASFARYKEVKIHSAGVPSTAGGTVNANPPPLQLAGATGTFYRDRQRFTLEAVPNAGSYLAGWSGSTPFYFLIGITSQFLNPFRGPLYIVDTAAGPYDYQAVFFNRAPLMIRAQAQDGEVLWLQATVGKTGETGTKQLMPFNAAAIWAAGQAGTATAPTGTTYVTTSMRLTFKDWDGDLNATVNVTAPNVAEPAKVATANFNKEYQAFRQVIPACAATMTLGGDGSGWYAHGSTIPVTLSPANGWVFVGWEGSLSGTALTPSYPVNDYPNLIARFNTVPTALTVTSVTPGIANSGGPTTITINGTGFTGSSEVYVNGIRQSSAQFVSSTQLTATVQISDLPTAGIALVTVSNRVGSGACTVSANGELDVKGALTADASPQTGWWWNPNESGRGFFIEKRGNNLFMAGYLYESDGRATWFSASGAMNGSSFSAGMASFRAGQTLTGAYTPPSNVPNAGTVQLDFSAGDRATLRWPGGTTQLQRFTFGSGTAGVGENGWWWNAAESGRGFSIEQQGSAIFMAGFMYDAAGNPVWYAGQGSVIGGTFSGNLAQYANGQTMTGAYQAPVVSNANVGAITLSFTGSTTANLTLPGGRVVPITRFAF